MPIDISKPVEHIALAIDTSDDTQADEWVALAKSHGAKYVKFGLEFSSAYGWARCAELAGKHDIGWIADAKLDDIPHTTMRAVTNIVRCEPKPYGITVHARAGLETLRLAQQTAGDCVIFGVTELTATPPDETSQRYSMTRGELVDVLIADVVECGVKGVVTSGVELPRVRQGERSGDLVTLIPGVRSAHADTNDQWNTVTPAQAVADGADIVTIGRQITRAADPNEAFERIIQEISAI